MDLSVLIPARNEMFLNRTINDILEHSRGKTEVLVVLDGKWPIESIRPHPRLRLLYHAKAIGQRAATNEAARLSKAEFIMKCDAHCSFREGFDVTMMEDCQYDWTMIPRMYNLTAFHWRCNKCGMEWRQAPTPTECRSKEGCDSQDFERIIKWQRRKGTKNETFGFNQEELKFFYWRNLRKRPEIAAQGEIRDTMSLLGACWMMNRHRYWELGGMDENHGSWGQMGTEIACKSWLSGGRLCVTRKTWFAHMFRTQGGDFGFPYRLTQEETNNARRYSIDLWKNNKWPGAKYPLSWLIKRFAPVPTWEGYNGSN